MVGIKKVLENPALPAATKQLAAAVFQNIHSPKPKPTPAATPDKKPEGPDQQSAGYVDMVGRARI